MFSFITGNLATIFVGAVVATVVILVARKMFLDRKNGKNSCSGNCANCPSGKVG